MVTNNADLRLQESMKSENKNKVKHEFNLQFAHQPDSNQFSDQTIRLEQALKYEGTKSGHEKQSMKDTNSFGQVLHHNAKGNAQKKKHRQSHYESMKKHHRRGSQQQTQAFNSQVSFKNRLESNNSASRSPIAGKERSGSYHSKILEQDQTTSTLVTHPNLHPSKPDMNRSLHESELDVHDMQPQYRTSQQQLPFSEELKNQIRVLQKQIFMKKRDIQKQEQINKHIFDQVKTQLILRSRLTSKVQTLAGSHQGSDFNPLPTDRSAQTQKSLVDRNKLQTDQQSQVTIQSVSPFKQRELDAAKRHEQNLKIQNQIHNLYTGRLKEDLTRDKERARMSIRELKLRSEIDRQENYQLSESNRLLKATIRKYRGFIDNFEMLQEDSLDMMKMEETSQSREVVTADQITTREYNMDTNKSNPASRSVSRDSHKHSKYQGTQYTPNTPLYDLKNFTDQSFYTQNQAQSKRTMDIGRLNKFVYQLKA